MRTSKLLLFSALVASVNSPMATAESGKFNFKGTITTSPCSISGADMDKDINLGVVTTNDLSNGDGNNGQSLPTDFTVTLENCDYDTASKSVRVTLTGNKSEYGTNNFGLDQPGRGAYLVVQKDGTDIIPGTATALQALVKGKNQLNFTAFIRGSGTESEDPVAGDFTATTNITLAYQ